jgi:hypothetical protein
MNKKVVYPSVFAVSFLVSIAAILWITQKGDEGASTKMSEHIAAEQGSRQHPREPSFSAKPVSSSEQNAANAVKKPPAATDAAANAETVRIASLIGTTLVDTNTPQLLAADVISKFKAMGFEFTEKKSSNPDTGSRRVLDIAEPQKGFSRMQIQYAEGNGREVLEGIRFTTDPSQLEAMVESAIRENAGVQVQERSASSAFLVRTDGYVIWFRVYDENNPHPDGGPNNVLLGGLEPGVE